jgi:hypothetical protein
MVGKGAVCFAGAGAAGSGDDGAAEPARLRVVRRSGVDVAFFVVRLMEGPARVVCVGAAEFAARDESIGVSMTQARHVHSDGHSLVRFDGPASCDACSCLLDVPQESSGRFNKANSVSKLSCGPTASSFPPP